MKLLNNRLGLRVALQLAFGAAVVQCFTAEQLISAPRRSSALPNKAGKLGIFHTSEYSFETHSKNSSWSVLDIDTGSVKTLFTDPNVSELYWLGTDDTSIIYVNASSSEVEGGVELWIGDVKSPGDSYKAASLPAPLANLKTAVTSTGSINFILSGLSSTDGTLYNAQTAKKPLSTARIYTSLFVRHWDVYIIPEKSTLFSGSLSKTSGGKKYTFSGDLKNLLHGSEGLETPVQPSGGAGDFDLSSDGSTVAFLSKAPDLDHANNTASYIYVVPHSGSSKPAAVNLPSKDYKPAGASAGPVFSPDGKSIAFLQMDENGYESDKNKVHIVGTSASSSIKTIAEDWDRSSSSITWAKDGESLWLIVEEHGQDKVFKLSVDGKTPEEITSKGGVSAVSELSKGTLFVSISSMVSSTGFALVDVESKKVKSLLQPNQVDVQLKGLNEDSLDQFWFDGVKTKVHGWIIKPSTFDEGKKYPIAFLIHGGPQGSWANSWGTRWNPKWYAEQGYVVIAINPTGSTGYGKQFTDDIQNEWGGRPYIDLVKGFNYAIKTYPFLDETRAVALGASYGGYMVNWIQGHDFGRRFKALVTHDGAFSTLNQYASDELWFPNHDFAGLPWLHPSNYERWNPASHLSNWSTPHLIIHNDLDYRLPVSEGIAPFNVLQTRGVPSKFLNFPDENHWVLNPENSLVWHQEVRGWINQWVGIGE